MAEAADLMAHAIIYRASSFGQAYRYSRHTNISDSKVRRRPDEFRQ